MVGLIGAAVLEVGGGEAVGAAEHFSPAINNNNLVATTGLTAALVLIGWAVVALLAGTWQTNRRDA